MVKQVVIYGEGMGKAAAVAMVEEKGGTCRAHAVWYVAKKIRSIRRYGEG